MARPRKNPKHLNLKALGLPEGSPSVLLRKMGCYHFPNKAGTSRMCSFAHYSERFGLGPVVLGSLAS